MKIEELFHTEPRVPALGANDNNSGLLDIRTLAASYFQQKKEEQERDEITLPMKLEPVALIPLPVKKNNTLVYFLLIIMITVAYFDAFMILTYL